jgi:hypothetical protein
VSINQRKIQATHTTTAAAATATAAAAAAAGNLRSALLRKVNSSSSAPQHCKAALFDDATRRTGAVKQWGLLGSLIHTAVHTPTKTTIADGIVNSPHDTELEKEPEAVYLNTHEPICMAVMGVQGAGKSHSVATIVENCLLTVPHIAHQTEPLATLIMHYDRDPANFCELVSLVRPTQDSQVAAAIANNDSTSVIKQLVVLVSPNNYSNRLHYYNKQPHTTVQPLLFSWSQLDAAQIQILMRLDTADVPLYMTVILQKLQQYQRANTKPNFEDFLKMCRNDNMAFSAQQAGPLAQRLLLLESIIADSQMNTEHTALDLNALYKVRSCVCDTCARVRFYSLVGVVVVIVIFHKLCAHAHVHLSIHDILRPTDADNCITCTAL